MKSLSKIYILPLKKRQFISIFKNNTALSQLFIFHSIVRKLMSLRPKQKEKKRIVLFVKILNIDFKKEMNPSFIRSLYQIFIKRWELETCIEVDSDWQGICSYEKKTILPEKKSLQVVYEGPALRIAAAYRALVKYAEENDLKLKNTAYEFFLFNPLTTPAKRMKVLLAIPIE